MDFAVPVDHRVKLNESEKRDKYLDFAWKLKKLWNMKVISYTNCYWCSWYSHQKTGTKTGGLENKGTGGHLQTTAKLRSGKILRGAIGTSGDLQSFKVYWKTNS